MATKKKKKATRPTTTDAEANIVEVDEVAAGDDKPASEQKSKKEAKSSEKGKEKAVVKSKARAKDPKKPDKKPNIFKRFAEYLKQVRLEIKRTTWPTKNEVLNMTIIVLVALLFFGAFIFVIDLVMVELVGLYAGLAPDAGVVDASALDAAADSANGGE